MAKYKRLNKIWLVIGRGGENIYKMFSCHHPIVSIPGLTHGGTGQGLRGEQSREWGNGNPEAAIVI